MSWKDPERKKLYMHEWYLQNRERTKPARQAWSKANRHKHRAYYRKWEAKDPQHTLFQRAKHTAKSRGLEWKIVEADIFWPTHCPVLGIELQYDRDKKKPHRDDYPSFDRWDGTKGYVPGNVFIVSWRANRIKWDCTLAELKAVARYAEFGLTVS